jgi:hypothetical protein
LKRGINKIVHSLKDVFVSLDIFKEKLYDDLSSREISLRTNVITPLSQEAESDQEMEIETEQELEEEQEKELEQEIQQHDIDQKYEKALVDWDKDKLFDGTLIDDPLRAVNLPTDRIPSQEIRKLNPVMPLQDILERGNLSIYADLFDPRIYGSLNLFPLFQSTELSNDRLFVPFHIYQGNMDFILISLNKQFADMSLVLITRDEALDVLGEFLINDSSASFSKDTDRYLLIYQFGNGFIRASGNYLRDFVKDAPLLQVLSELEKNPTFMSLLVQAKFLSGRTYFTEAEKPFLEEWVQNSQRTYDLLEFFQSKIIQFKDHTKENFTYSILGQVLFQVDRESEEGK